MTNEEITTLERWISEKIEPKPDFPDCSEGEIESRGHAWTERQW